MNPPPPSPGLQPRNPQPGSLQDGQPHSGNLQSPNLQSSIHKQTRLPLSVAFEVVLQGIQIRLGRSIVTLLGVGLGIAFLMAVLTGHALRGGVAAERAARAEATRMESFLVAETGPLRDRDIAVLMAGPLGDAEGWLLRRLASAGVAQVSVLRGQSAGLPALARGARVREVAPDELARGASAVLVVGDGPVPDLDWAALLRGARQPVVALTRGGHAAPGAGIARVVTLARVLRDDERQAAEVERRRETFRTIWITVISLLVTVIGISNAMLMSVTERFREIGTMKCLGALSHFIRQVFFIEASLIGMAGSVLGGIVGCLFAVGGMGLTYGFGLVLAALSPLALSGYFAVCVSAGVVLAIGAAVYPARFAARMVPAAALRSTI
jgi:hypothetical protein